MVGVCVALMVPACGDSDDGATSSTSPAPAPTTTSTAAPAMTTTTMLPDVWPTERWPVATPEEMGMSSSVLVDLVEDAATVYWLDSVTVVRHGHVVLDTVIYPFPEDQAHNIHSCTKSVTGTLIGIAIDQGLLAGVDVPVVDVLPAAAPTEIDALKAAMTVEDLLTMRSGLECRDSYRYEWQGLIEMRGSTDWAAHVLALPMSEEPGTRFEYCNGASELLSAILTEVTGKPASEFADEVLFGPLGISDYVWPANPQGISFGSGDLMLLPTDMAKIGYLYLRNGEWDGKQIVPQWWVEAATAVHAAERASADGYGYQWWINWAGHPMAIGFAGQYIIILPEFDLVVTFTATQEALEGSGDMPVALGADPLLALVYTEVLGAIESDDALPADPEAQARLAAAVDAASSGPDGESVVLPELAAAIDGVRYRFRPNEWGWHWFEIDFDGDVAVIRGENVAGPYEWELGLDGRYRADADASVLTRGAWPYEHVFVVEYYVIGHAERGTVEYIFEDGAARVRHIETTTGYFESARADPAP